MDNHKQYSVFKSCCLILSPMSSGHATTVAYSFSDIIKPPFITFCGTGLPNQLTWPQTTSITSLSITVISFAD